MTNNEKFVTLIGSHLVIIPAEREGFVFYITFSRRGAYIKQSAIDAVMGLKSLNIATLSDSIVTRELDYDRSFLNPPTGVLFKDPTIINALHSDHEGEFVPNFRTAFEEIAMKRAESPFVQITNAEFIYHRAADDAEPIVLKFADFPKSSGFWIFNALIPFAEALLESDNPNCIAFTETAVYSRALAIDFHHIDGQESFDITPRDPALERMLKSAFKRDYDSDPKRFREMIQCFV